jgi:hypothetical protein
MPTCCAARLGLAGASIDLRYPGYDDEDQVPALEFARAVACLTDVARMSDDTA